MSDQLTFANPNWLFLILLVIPLLAIKATGSSSSRAALEKLTSTRLRPHLVTSTRPLGDWGRFLIQLLGLILVILALARPQKGYIEEITRVEGRNIIIAIDTSRSMLAEDIPPNRLGQAKLAAADLINELPEDRIGLIVFAGTAYMQAPLTPDHDALIETIDQLDTYVIRRGGTNLTAAIEEASRRFSETESARNALVLFTDGDDLEGKALEAARSAKKEDILIITVGVGLPIGSVVPDPESRLPGVFLRDENGELVKSRMDAESLEKIAKATNGIFVNLQGGLMNSKLIKDVLANITYSESKDKLTRVPREYYAIPLIAGLVCLVIGFLAALWGSRPSPRPAVASFLTGLLAVLALTGDSSAASAPDKAYKAYDEGDYEGAQDAFVTAIQRAEEPLDRERYNFGMGASAYKAGEYDEAITAFGKSLITEDVNLQEDSHYNLGNTLFRKGEKQWKDPKKGGLEALDDVIATWEDAADHFQSTLDLNDDNEDAAANLKIVTDLLEKLEEMRPEPEEPEEEPEEPEEPEQEPNEEESKEEKEKPEPEKDPKEEEDKSDEKEDGEEGDEGDDEKEGEGQDETDQEGDPGEDDGEPGEDEGSESGDDKEGSENEGEGSKEGEEEPKEGETDQESEKEGDGEGEKATAGKESEEEGEPKEMKPAEGEGDPDDELEDTGYSKNKARQLLRSLSDEEDLGLLRRRKARQGSSRYRDW